MNMTFKLVGLATFGALATAITINCSSSSSGGGRSLSTQEAALNKTVTALSSLSDLVVDAQIPFAGMRAQTSDAFCDASGDTTIPSNDATWAFAKFLCAGAHNTYSPDSALGALSLMKGIICTVDSQGVTYTALGTAVNFSNVALTSTCFPQEMLTAFANESQPITAISGTITGLALTNSGWDFKLEFRNMSPIDNFDIYVRSSSNVIAAAYQKVGGGDSWTVTIDQRATPNKLTYEAARENRHIRLHVEGSISSNGTVNSVTSMAGILGNLDGGTEYVALSGTGTAGVSIRYQKQGQAEVTSDCFDVDDIGATCGGVPTPPNFTAADVTGFANAGAVTAAEANFDNNPISMAVSGFPTLNAPAAAFSSTLR